MNEIIIINAGKCGILLKIIMNLTNKYFIWKLWNLPFEPTFKIKFKTF